MSTAAVIEPQKIELILAQVDNLPPLAPVATKILQLTSDTQCRLGQIVELIETDPSLTARVLSLVRSAERGVRPEAATVPNAVRLLGLDTIRHVTLTQKVVELFGRPERDVSDGFDRREFWKHCLATACCARHAAEAVGGMDAEEAFVCGMLHDLGKIALAAAMPKSYAKAARLCNERRGDIADAERAILGVDHTAVGHRLALRWGLPQRLVECVWLHHQSPEGLPESVAAGQHVQIVQFADTLAREQHIGYSGNHQFLQSSRELGRRLGLDDERRSRIADSLADEIAARAAWIGDEDLTSREVWLQSLSLTTDDLIGAHALLAQQRRAATRMRGCLSGLGELAAGRGPQSSVHEICAAAARALRTALDAEAAVVFTVPADGRWIEYGVSGAGGTESRLERIDLDMRILQEEMELAVQMAVGQPRFTPPPRGFDPLLERFIGALGGGRVWMIPLVRKGRWIGGALLTAGAEQTREWQTETGDLAILLDAAALALTEGQSHRASTSLSQELAEVNRRLTATQAELLRTRTLETVVQIAAGAAHELNNPLAVIKGRAQLLQRQLDQEDHREALAQIARQAQTCSDIVTELLEFAEPPAPQPRAVNLAAVLETLRSRLLEEGLIGETDLTLEAASDTTDVWFDDAQLRGALWEILKNAAESTKPQERRITVKTRRDPADKSIVVSVADNGRGMTPEVLAQAADPFFSHRPAGRGRGLGLARVQRWMALNAGGLWIESRPGEGTRVELRLGTRNSEIGT